MEFGQAEKLVIQALFLLGIDKIDVTLAGKPKAFADIVIKALEVGNPALKFVRVDKLKAKIKSQDGKGGVEITLARMFDALRGLNDEGVRERVTGTVVELSRTMLPLAGAFPDDVGKIDPERVIPLVKRAIDFPLPKEGDNGNSVVRFEFGNGLVFVPVIDNPETYVFITHRMAEDEGFTSEQLREMALANLAKAASKYLPLTNYERGPQVIGTFGGHASSLVLLPEFWIKEAIKARDSLLIHMADTDTLVVARMGDVPSAITLITAPLIGAMPGMFHGHWCVYDQNGMRVAGLEDFALGRRVAKTAAEARERVKQKERDNRDRERREKQNDADAVRSK